MKTIVIANQKGGIGKTSTSINLAQVLQNKGFKVLLIDSDQQGNSSDNYRAKIDNVATLYDVLLSDEHISLTEAIQKTDMGYILPSDPLLRKADEILNSDVNGLWRLKDAIEEVNNDFDYIIIDTAPTVNSILYNCLIASDLVIIPVVADRFSLQGLSKLNEIICAVQKRQNKHLKIEGLLLVKDNKRTNLSKEVKESLSSIANTMKTRVFNTVIRNSIKVQEAQALRVSLFDYAENSTVAKDYNLLINELIN